MTGGKGRGLVILRTVAEVREAVDAWRGAALTVGLVPTMGALHDGHLSLVTRAREACARVVVSLFVNPSQFAPGEDFAVYPRDEEGDRAKLESLGVDVIYAPMVGEMYPPGFATSVQVRGLTQGLCGASRPHHFEGVATVVTKLFIQVRPDLAFFGEKDYQQLQVIRRLVTDLDLPVRVEGVTTRREADGLALSSRNAYLSAKERCIAPALYRVLTALAQRLAPGGAEKGAPARQEAAPKTAWEIAREVANARQELEGAGFTRVEYLEIRDGETLEPVTEFGRPARALAAAWLGATRLIDNVPVPPEG